MDVQKQIKRLKKVVKALEMESYPTTQPKKLFQIAVRAIRDDGIVTLYTATVTENETTSFHLNGSQYEMVVTG